MKTANATQLSLALKIYGLAVENNNNQGLLANLKAFWARTGRNYLFLVTPNFTIKEASSEKFKTTIAFCKANNFKFIVVTQKDGEDLSLAGDDPDKVEMMGYKVILNSRIKELYSEMMLLK